MINNTLNQLKLLSKQIKVKKN